MIRSKKRVRKVSWRSGRIREDAAGMAKLRAGAYARSQGLCECAMCPDRKSCGKRVSWTSGQLHHIVSRARGGSDVLANVAFVRRECHREITGEPKFEWNWLAEIMPHQKGIES